MLLLLLSITALYTRLIFNVDINRPLALGEATDPCTLFNFSGDCTSKGSSEESGESTTRVIRTIHNSG